MEGITPRSKPKLDILQPLRRWELPDPQIGACGVIRSGAQLRMVTVERTCLVDERHQARWAERILVERLSGGDETALADLYDRYGGFVYGLAVRTLVDRHAAEDVTQDVFVYLWEHPERIEPGRGTLRGFLGTLTHRRAVDAVRRAERRRRREARVAREATDVPDGAEAMLRADTTGKVRTALEVLPEPQRQALELAYFNGYTYRQVADVLGIPEGTAKSRLRMALARIAKTLETEMSEPSERWT
jgi:RNA polymerase sigma factor (sigma-70 family)